MPTSPDIRYNFHLAAAILVVLSHQASGTANGKDATLSDGRARSVIFGESIRRDSALSIHLKAARLAPEARFKVLSNWVLPSDLHESLRVDAELMPVDPVIAADSDVSASGGTVVSPALDLIETAKLLNRVASVRDVIRDFRPSETQQKRSLASFQATLAMSHGETDTALLHMDELTRLAVEPAASRGPEFVAIAAARRSPDMLEAAYALADVCHAATGGRESEAERRYLAGLKFGYEALQFEAAIESTSPPKSGDEPQLWTPVSRMTAASRGAGYPRARWRFAKGRGRHMTAHDHDYLYFASPLSGEFTIEADVTTIPHRDIHVALGGRWSGATSNAEFKWLEITNGMFRGENPPKPSAEPLSIVGDWMRVRIQVGQDQQRTWINGRLIDRRRYDRNSDPWLAVHSSSNGGGSIRNVCITGSPAVPPVIRLASNEELPGWFSYYGESVGPGGDWQLISYQAGEGMTAELRGRGNSLAGTLCESLLQYHRPMLEDGEIEYEFFYSTSPTSTTMVHPALDRLCFLLTPSGVRIHLATDGVFDTLGNDPANGVTAPLSDAGVGGAAPTLPLIAEAWNRLQLRLSGDVVTLSLNGQPVYTHRLATSNRRRFGFFHYADRGEAGIRNIRWRGDWPQQVADVQRQELADQRTLRMIGEARDLSLILDHSFDEGLPSDLFSIYSARRSSNISAESAGVYVRRAADSGRYQLASFGPRVQLRGDFEVTAEFDGLVFSQQPGGPCNVQLLVKLADKAGSEYRLVRRDWNVIENNVGLQRTILPRVIRNVANRSRRLNLRALGEEATSGRLRIVRRGDQLFLLFAEYDSSVFRVVGQQAVGKEPTVPLGIRLIAEATRNAGAMQVVWKRLTIRAEGVVP